MRIASHKDLSRIAEALALAFYGDPTWSWAFPDPNLRRRHLTVWWRLYVEGALRYSWVLMTDHCEAASVWIPPGGAELAGEDEADVEQLLEDLVGPRATEVVELLARFEAAHPKDRPHYYLSLLGTHPAHAGRGLGMALLAENLQRIDEEQMPAYLESSNPANNHRYERYGFAKIGEFYPPSSDVPVTTMWRHAR